MAVLIAPGEPHLEARFPVILMVTELEKLGHGREHGNALQQHGIGGGRTVLVRKSRKVLNIGRLLVVGIVESRVGAVDDDLGRTVLQASHIDIAGQVEYHFTRKL